MADHSRDYSDSSFWRKVKKYARILGKKVLIPVLTLYYCLLDPQTPARSKAVIIGALGYFISPIDVIPDPIPVVGYSDDLLVLVGAMAVVAAHIKQEHKDQADRQSDFLLG